jgi:hypothetical protein
MSEAPRRLLCDRDIGLFDALVAEEVRLYGVSGEYYFLKKQDYDPVDQELYKDLFEGPFPFMSNTEWLRTDGESEATENGYKKVWEADVRIPRTEFERMGAGRAPRFGDAVRLFVAEEYGDRWFDVVSASQGEPVFSSANFVWYVLKVRMRTEYAPTRRMKEEDLT